MIGGFFKGLNERGVSPVIAIVLLLMMTVAAAGAAYFWLTSMQSGMQKRSTKSIENIMRKSGRRLIAQAAICKPTAPDGMVGWWEFYEGEGSKTHDSSGNENTGTIFGANWTDGRAGKALDFDGADDCVDGIPLSSLNRTEMLESGTISVWFNVNEWGSGDIVNVYPKRPRLTTVSWNPNSLYFEWYGSSGFPRGGDSLLFGNIPKQQWHRCSFRWINDIGEFWIYLDGELQWSGDSIDFSSFGWDGQDFEIGGTVDYFNGSIDEVRIYDRALSAEEINKTYKGKMKVRVTVRNVGSVEVPEAKFVANLKKDGTTVDSDTYTTTSSIDTGDLKTLTFYFNEMRPEGEYNINIPGIDVSQSVKCQSLE